MPVFTCPANNETDINNDKSKVIFSCIFLNSYQCKRCITAKVENYSQHYNIELFFHALFIEIDCKKPFKSVFLQEKILI